MERRSQDRVVRTGQPRRRGFVSRLLTLGTLGMAAIIVLAACGPNVDKPYSTTSPASPTADDIQSLYKLVFWLSLIVFVGVQFAIVYLSLRFRRSSDSPDRPPQIHGSRRLEIIWTVIPAVVLLVLLIPTITTLYDHDAAAQDGDLIVDVYGKQWWWEIQYGEDETQGGQSLDVTTANEIWLPVGKKAQINLHSNNVIHSFWVPRLSGKMDVIPGHVNTMSVTPTEVGEYYGDCAEFCGDQHAWMRFKINVVPEDEFYAWVNNWRSVPPSSARAEEADIAAGVVKAPDTFAVCLACHRVNGMEGALTPQGLEAPANMGPDLTMLACRETIAAGMLDNTPENLAKWLKDPGAVKPGNYMADQIGPGAALELTDEQVAELVEFLEGMQPAGGCSDPQGWAEGAASPAASPMASPVASPAATPEAGS
jgi:cytochrome c oxidase subunit II